MYIYRFAEIMIKVSSNLLKDDAEDTLITEIKRDEEMWADYTGK